MKRGPLLRTWFTTWVAGVISSFGELLRDVPSQVAEDGTEVGHRPLKAVAGTQPQSIRHDESTPVGL